MNAQRDLQELKEVALNELPRLTENDSFSFRCHSGLKCFGHCCGDVTIVLSPYDILRMKNALGITSEEFLRQYTFVPFQEEQRLPIVILRMKEGEGRRCPFVEDSGCTIYKDRPWACRMYPLGMASPKNEIEQGKPFYFLMKDLPCEGLNEQRSLSVGEWLEDQDIIEFNRMGEDFKDITLHNYFIQGGNLDPQKMEMFYMACYDIDRFRRFVFESRFLDNFDLPAGDIESFRNDDAALMRFAFRWLRFSLFGEQIIRLKDSVRRKKEREISR